MRRSRPPKRSSNAASNALVKDGLSRVSDRPGQDAVVRFSKVVIVECRCAITPARGSAMPIAKSTTTIASRSGCVAAAGAGTAGCTGVSMALTEAMSEAEVDERVVRAGGEPRRRGDARGAQPHHVQPEVNHSESGARDDALAPEAHHFRNGHGPDERHDQCQREQRVEKLRD